MKQMSAEAAYHLLLAYAFAGRYAEGKSVAVVGLPEEPGTSILANVAESVKVLSETEGKGEASAKPNVAHRSVSLPELPSPEGSFEVVIALQVIETLDRPEKLVAEARRVLQERGVFIVSTVDRLVRSGQRRDLSQVGESGMFIPDFREMLESHFDEVRLYRQGVVAGAIVVEESGEAFSLSVESVSFYSADSVPEVGMPVTDRVMAVCGGGEALPVEDPYLLLDRDRSVFDENDELLENVELLRKEVRRMEETEVQAFHEALGGLRARERELVNRERRLENRISNLNAHIDNIERSRLWRFLALLRRLRGAPSSERPG